jgi:hypothetical protein
VPHLVLALLHQQCRVGLSSVEIFLFVGKDNFQLTVVGLNDSATTHFGSIRTMMYENGFFILTNNAALTCRIDVPLLPNDAKLCENSSGLISVR